MPKNKRINKTDKCVDLSKKWSDNFACASLRTAGSMKLALAELSFRYSQLQQKYDVSEENRLDLQLKLHQKEACLVRCTTKLQHMELELAKHSKTSLITMSTTDKNAQCQCKDNDSHKEGDRTESTPKAVCHAATQYDDHFLKYDNLPEDDSHDAACSDLSAYLDAGSYQNPTWRSEMNSRRLPRSAHVQTDASCFDQNIKSQMRSTFTETDPPNTTQSAQSKHRSAYTQTNLLWSKATAEQTSTSTGSGTELGRSSTIADISMDHGLSSEILEYCLLPKLSKTQSTQTEIYQQHRDFELRQLDREQRKTALFRKELLKMANDINPISENHHVHPQRTTFPAEVDLAVNLATSEDDYGNRVNDALEKFNFLQEKVKRIISSSPFDECLTD